MKGASSGNSTQILPVFKIWNNGSELLPRLQADCRAGDCIAPEFHYTDAINRDFRAPAYPAEHATIHQ
jgi:hypothetical protein